MAGLYTNRHDIRNWNEPHVPNPELEDKPEVGPRMVVIGNLTAYMSGQVTEEDTTPEPAQDPPDGRGKTPDSALNYCPLVRGT